MKKVLMVLLSAMLVLSMAGAVSADEIPVNSLTQDGITVDSNSDDIPDSGYLSSTVILALKELYTVSIPSQINLLPNSDHSAYVGQANLKVNIIRLDSGHSLELYVSSENATTESWMLTLVDDDGNPILNGGNHVTLPYRLGYGTTNEHIDEGATVIAAPTTLGDKVLIQGGITVSRPDYYIHAKLPMPSNGNFDSGYYQDNLKFTVKVNTGTSSPGGN